MFFLKNLARKGLKQFSILRVNVLHVRFHLEKHRYVFIFFYTPHNNKKKVRGVYWIHLVCPSVRPYVSEPSCLLSSTYSLDTFFPCLARMIVSIRGYITCYPPSVYYCNISIFQSLVTSHVYMTLGIPQLAMFASKNKQVVHIWIQVSHVEAVLERWSLLSWWWQLWRHPDRNTTCSQWNIFTYTYFLTIPTIYFICMATLGLIQYKDAILSI